jgi:hypothetical protein
MKHTSIDGNGMPIYARDSLITLMQIKSEWEFDSLGHPSRESYKCLEQHIRDNYTPVYNKELDFMGYERS